MNKPFTPKQTCRFFVLFYALFSAFFIYSYMVNEPISGSFLLMLPAIQIVRSFKTEEEKFLKLVVTSKVKKGNQYEVVMELKPITKTRGGAFI